MDFRSRYLNESNMNSITNIEIYDTNNHDYQKEKKYVRKIYGILNIDVMIKQLIQKNKEVIKNSEVKEIINNL